jgi:peptide-methionine (S)-S-oxide reductase
MRRLFAVLLLSLTAFAAPLAKADTAVFAGGCFWCVETNFDKVKGVSETISGYAGGTMKNPTYQNHEGNQEAEKITFDPAQVSYKDLVRYFLRTTDVLDDGGQFCDRGNAYKSVIFTMDPAQRKDAEEAVAEAEKYLGKKIATPIRDFTTFTDAEDYHQNYHLGQNRVLTRFGWVKQSYAYEEYRKGCGRDARVEQLWGKQANTTGQGNDILLPAK